MDARVVGVLATLLVGHRHPRVHLFMMRLLAQRELLAAGDPWWDNGDEHADCET